MHETREYHRKGLKFVNAGGSVLGVKQETMSVNVLNVTNERITNEIIHFPCENINQHTRNNFYPSKAAFERAAKAKEICLN